MKTATNFVQLEVIIVESLKMKILFCEKNDIQHNFYAPSSPQQNGVVERKNISLKGLARTILTESSFLKYLWVDVVSTTFYVMNSVLIRPILKKKNLMNFTTVENRTLIILKFLAANVLYLIMVNKTLEDLMLNLMKVFFLDSH